MAGNVEAVADKYYFKTLFRFQKYWSHVMKIDCKSN